MSMRRARLAIAAAMAAAALACGDAGGGSAPSEEIVCRAVEVARFRLRPDPSCVIAGRDETRRHLPDLDFSPGLCFAGDTARAVVEIPGGPAIELSISVHSGIAANAVARAALAPLPAPLVDGTGARRSLISFAAASVIDVASPDDGTPLGTLVTRDTGWAELGDGPLPAFASERLVVVAGGEAGAFSALRGEVFGSGDEFGAGASARGSLCGPPDVFARLAAARAAAEPAS